MINTNWENHIDKGYEILDNIYSTKDNNIKIYPSRKKTFRCFKYFKYNSLFFKKYNSLVLKYLFHY